MNSQTILLHSGKCLNIMSICQINNLATYLILADRNLQQYNLFRNLLVANSVALAILREMSPIVYNKNGYIHW